MADNNFFIASHKIFKKLKYWLLGNWCKIKKVACSKGNLCEEVPSGFEPLYELLQSSA